ncbi:hypothetical protein [Anaerosporobacter sp.]|uniref:hypothetical protein n=1 Tax=Anaerosporobacter sp. TaxID=1872529 RepID=UPI00286ED56B|nr:hypothetical protein [Anaerosporobacter sp.]
MYSIQYTGIAPISFEGDGYVIVDGVKYKILMEAHNKCKRATNSKEYVELIELLAYEVFIIKTEQNNNYFENANGAYKKSE